MGLTQKLAANSTHGAANLTHRAANLTKWGSKYLGSKFGPDPAANLPQWAANFPHRAANLAKRGSKFHTTGSKYPRAGSKYPRTGSKYPRTGSKCQKRSFTVPCPLPLEFELPLVPYCNDSFFPSRTVQSVNLERKTCTKVNKAPTLCLT